jgi:prevent-host-death family protein
MENIMNYLKFTEFRNKSKDYFDKVEKGNSFIIIRKGKPIARIMPFSESSDGWKREIKKVVLKKCKDSSEYILSERNEK